MELSTEIFPLPAPSFSRWLVIIKNAVSDVLSPSNSRRKHEMLEHIIENYDSMVSRLCFGYCSSKVEYEDLRQDVYVNIWKGLERFRGDSSIKTWIYRVTLNTCVSTLRKTKSQAQYADLSEVADLNDTSDEYVANVKQLYRAIELLPALDKAIVMMWLDEISYEEIASTVGMARNAVATRLHRIKIKLKQLY